MTLQALLIHTKKIVEKQSITHYHCLCVGVLYSRKARIPTLPHLPDKFVEFREEKEQCVSERCYTATNPTSKNDTL